MPMVCFLLFLFFWQNYPPPPFLLKSKKKKKKKKKKKAGPPFLKSWIRHCQKRKLNLGRGVEILLPVNFVEFRSEVSEKKWKISQPIRDQGGHLVFLIGPNNTNMVEDVEILLPVKFSWIQFSGFRKEVENGSANQRPGRPSCFSDGPEKHKLGRGRWDLASCQVSLNSVQRFKRSRKCLSQSEAREAILFFRSARKNTT